MKTENYKTRLKSRSLKWLKEKAKEVFHKWIRERDQIISCYNFKCISCNRIKPTEMMQAGHFYPAGSYRSLEFDPDNVHGQCIQCNYYGKESHATQYRANLKKKIGKERLDRLDLKARYERRNGFVKFEKSELIEIVLKYK